MYYLVHTCVQGYCAPACLNGDRFRNACGIPHRIHVICGIVCCGKFISTFVPTVVVGTVRRYRFNTYLFPTVDCTIKNYVEKRRPVRYVELLGCLEEVHGVRGKRSLDSGLDAGVEDGYIRAVPVGSRRGYVPTPLGVIDDALFFNVVMDYEAYGASALPELLTALRSHMLIDLIQRISMTAMRMFIEEDIFKLNKEDKEKLQVLLPWVESYSELERVDLLGAWLTLKALAGLVEEGGFGPRECEAMYDFLQMYTFHTVGGLVGPRIVSSSIRNERFRSWAIAITHANFLFLLTAFRNKGTK